MQIVLSDDIKMKRLEIMKQLSELKQILKKMQYETKDLAIMEVVIGSLEESFKTSFLDLNID